MGGKNGEEAEGTRYGKRWAEATGEPLRELRRQGKAAGRCRWEDMHVISKMSAVPLPWQLMISSPTTHRSQPFLSSSHHRTISLAQMLPTTPRCLYERKQIECSKELEDERCATKRCHDPAGLLSRSLPHHTCLPDRDPQIPSPKTPSGVSIKRPPAFDHSSAHPPRSSRALPSPIPAISSLRKCPSQSLLLLPLRQPTHPLATSPLSLSHNHPQVVSQARHGRHPKPPQCTHILRLLFLSNVSSFFLACTGGLIFLMA